MRGYPEQLHIRLFGGFAVTLGQQTLVDGAWNRSRAKALVKLLALQPMRSMHREQVIEALWPGADPSSAQNQLHKNLYYLRQRLNGGAPGGLLRLTGPLLELHPDATVDVAEFRALSTAALRPGGVEPLEQALTLYSGDLLPEDLYEPWTEPHREDLRALRRRLAMELARRNASERRFEDAAELLRGVLSVEPAFEEAHRELMRAYAAAGERERALRQYERCASILADELAAEPSPQTRALADEIRLASGLKGTVGNEVDQSERAGDEAKRAFVWEDARSHYREAIRRLRAAGRDDLREATLWLRLADATAPIATNSEVAEYCRRAVDLARQGGSFELLAKAIFRFQDATDTVPGNNAGHREAAQLIEEALVKSPPGDSAGKALLLAAGGRPLAAASRKDEGRHATGRMSLAGHPDPAIERRLRGAVDMARRVDDRNVLAYALTRLRTYITRPDTLYERLELTREMIAVSTQPTHLRWEFEAHMFRQEDLLEIGDIDGARIEATAMRRLGESLNADAILAVAYSMQVTHDTADGALGNASRMLRASRDLDQKVGINSNADHRFLVQSLVLRWNEGRIREVEQDFHGLVDRHPSNVTLRAPLALIYAESGRPSEARAELRTLVAQQPIEGIPPDHLWWFTIACLSHASAATMSASIACELYKALLSLSDRNASTWMAISFGSASLLLGRLAGCIGDMVSAERHLQEALAFNVRTRQRTWSARTRFHYAELLSARGSAGDRERARELARVALADAEEIGMTRLKIECERLLSTLSELSTAIRFAVATETVPIAYVDQGMGGQRT